ncbi:MAG: hypothetical protein FJ388_21665, partial [Verrucomicrobia bacterium]|nr:hypothetical protein [Verrucomicrobiota bacterium]
MKNLLLIVLWLATLSAFGGDEMSLTLAVEEAAGVARVQWPARGGIPFGRGKLREPALVGLMDGKREIPLQKKVLAVWPDGSVRWLLVDFLADVAAAQTARYTLEYGDHARANARPQAAVSVRQEAGRIWLDTGALRFALDTKAFRGIEEVALAGREKIIGREGALRLVKDSGEEFRADRLPPDEVVVEDSGPIRASVKVAGWFAAAGGEKFCRYEARVFAWAGRQDVQCDLTWIFTGDPEQERIRELSLSLWADVGDAAAFGIGLDGRAERRGSGAAVLFQKDWKEFELRWNVSIATAPHPDPLPADAGRGRSSAPKEQSNPLVPSVATTTVSPLPSLARGEGQGEGSRSGSATGPFRASGDGQSPVRGQQWPGWIELAGRKGRVGVLVRDGWQQFPKSCQADTGFGELRIG